MIVVVGEALVDLVIGVDGSVEATVGGAPFNTARACGRLGADVAFAGAVSSDRFGSLLLDRLRADGVSTSAVVRVEEPTTLAAAELDRDGSATYRFYIDGTAAPLLDAAPPLEDATAVFAGGLALVLQPMADTVEEMLTSRPARGLAMIDVNCRPHVIADRDRYVDRVRRVVASSHVVKVSDDDLGYLSPDASVDDAARRLLDLGPSVVLVTAGGKGVTVHSSDQRMSVPVEPVGVADTIGAGDSFAGGFLAWWTIGRHTLADLAVSEVVRDAVEAANTVAGITCTRRGAEPPWRSELPAGWAN